MAQSLFRRATASARYRLRRRRKGRPDRDKLLTLLPRHGICAEIGVWKGDFSAQLLQQLQPECLHLVDPWRFAEEHADRLYGGRVARSQADMDRILGDVEQRFHAEIESGTVRVHRMPSSEAARQLERETFDVVYVDGDHSYDAVAADLKAWAPLVKSDGYLTGDDYLSFGEWWADGVGRAVDEFAAAGGWQLQLLGTQFLLKREPTR